jgi:hypothetical protein
LLVPGQSSDIELAEEATLLGLSLNAARGGGVLEIAAEGGVRHETRPFDAENGLLGREMIHVVHPLATPLRGRRFRFGLAPGSRPDAFLEIEAAVFRTGDWPASAQPVPAAMPAPLALTPFEVALAQAAAAAREAQTSPEAVQIGRQFRRLLTGTPPAWSSHPSQVARFLAQLGVALGDDRAARRLLQQAIEAYPEVEELRADFTRLARTMKRG